MSPTHPEQYVFVTPVWGDAYVDRFVKVSLPSQLSAGNLGAVPRDRTRYLIYTRREWLGTIRRSPAFRRLKELVPAAILSLDDLPDPRIARTPHQLQTAAYTRGICSARGKDAAFVFMTPDHLVADGAFANLIRLTEAGRRVVLIATIRMTADGAVACISRHREGRRPEVAIPPRELVRASLDNLHPISEGHVVRGGRVLAPQHFYWKIGTDGLLVREFHIHPLLVWPRDPSAAIRNTLDDEYISRACPNPADWYIVPDSDEMCLMEFSEARHKLGMLAPKPLTDGDVLRFIDGCTNADHRLIVRQSVRLHTQDIDPEVWAPAEAAAEKLITGYLDEYAANGAPPAPATTEEPQTSPRPPGLLGRLRGSGSLVKAAALALAVPFWILYRLVNFKVYRYLDRLNAELTLLRAELRATRDRLQQQLDGLSDEGEEPAPSARVKTIRKPR